MQSNHKAISQEKITPPTHPIQVTENGGKSITHLKLGG